MTVRAAVTIAVPSSAIVVQSAEVAALKDTVVHVKTSATGLGVNFIVYDGIRIGIDDLNVSGTHLRVSP